MSELNQVSEKKSFIDKYAKILVVVAVLLGATSGNFGVLISAPPTVIGFWRLTISLPFFVIPVLCNQEKRTQLMQISKKNLLLSFVAGAFLFAHYFSWYSAVKLTKIASAAVLASFHPLVVIFISVFIYKKNPSWKSIVAILVALGGGALIMCTDISAFTGGKLSGNLLALTAGICMGVYFAVGGKVREEVEGSIYVMLLFFSCWFCFTVSNVATATPVLGYPAMDYFYMLCLAVLCQICSHAVFNLCMGRVSSLYVSAWETGDPVFSTLFAVIMIHQIPTVIEIIGCIIVVGALLAYNKVEEESI